VLSNTRFFLLFFRSTAIGLVSTVPVDGEREYGSANTCATAGRQQVQLHDRLLSTTPDMTWYWYRHYNSISSLMDCPLGLDKYMVNISPRLSANLQPRPARPGEFCESDESFQDYHPESVAPEHRD
jgi:hypothetical protein